MKKKRLIMWGSMALLIAFCAVLVFDAQLRYHPCMLEEALSPMSGSLLPSGAEQFGVPDFSYGEDFPTTVKMLGLQEWFTEDRMNFVLDNIESAKGQCNQYYSDTQFSFTAFGNKKYTLGFHLSKALKCYMLEFTASFEDPKTDLYLAASDQESNLLPYKDACQYFYELLDEFKKAYGIPYLNNTAPALENVCVEDVAKKPFSINNYAQWRIAGSTGMSILHLYAAPITDVYTDETTLRLIIKVYVAKEIPDVSVNEIISELPQ